MNQHKSLGRLLSLLTALAILLSLWVVPAAAAAAETPGAQFQNTSCDGGDDSVSLSAERTFLARIPVDMTEEEAAAAAAEAVWSLDYDESRPYVDPALFPNHTAGGPLSGWLCSDGETPLFTDIAAGAETVDGQVYLTLTFGNVGYWGDDLSVPHVNGGAYLDVCGNFFLTASLDGTVLGAVDVKVAPYDNFHTMEEIYQSLVELVDYANENTDLYVGYYSMGSSQGDNGLESLDMPYLIIARDQDVLTRWQALKAQAESDPSALIDQIERGALGDYQVPVMYSNIHANEVSATDGVLAFAWMLVEAAAGDGVLSYDTLTGFTAEGEAELAAQMGPAGQEGSVAVPDLVADTASYLGYIKGENPDGTTADASVPVDLERYYTVETQTLTVDDLLDDVFFLIVPEENVEGRTYITRTSSGGFDLNRDNSFQTQAETQNMTRLIAEWNPVSFTEFHGRVTAFQCEPCDPPHEPNFEYDLLAENLMAGGEALGIAAVANNDGHNSYVIPQRDYLTYTGDTAADGSYETQWLDPWDDMSTSYTPQYAMLHGTVSYTVEVPAYDDFMVEGVAYGQLGQSAYIAENKENYLLNQTKIFERGVTNANSDAYELVGQWLTDQYDVEGAEADLFRPEYDGEGQNGNFYPDCYIIPLDGDNQRNPQAAADMLVYLTRNGVQVLVAEESFLYDGTEYPAGTLVVSMYQAKRSVANGVLYDGTVITEWPVLYSEGITAFNYTRGFDMAVCAEPAAYADIAAACGEALDYEAAQDYVAGLTSAFFGETGASVVLMNASEDSTAAVNQLLQGGKSVSWITDGAYAGSFLISYEDWLDVADEYLLTGIGIAEELSGVAAQALTKAPVVYISGRPGTNDSGFVHSTLTSGSYQYNYDRQAMETLGFTVTDNAAEADLIIGAAALDGQALAAVRSGTPYIGYGANALESAVELFADGQLVRETAGDAAMDALSYVTYPTESLVTASYVAEGDDILYGYGAGYFAAIPDGAQVLIRLDSERGLLEGFLPSTGEHYADFLDDSIQAISYQGAGADGATLDVVLFANTLTNKTHQRDEYNFISNAAWASVLGDSGDEAATGFTDVPAGTWYAADVATVTGEGLMTGVTEATFVPGGTASRSMLATILWRMAGEPAATASAGFADVPAAAWYAAAVDWAFEAGVTSGADENLFQPDGALTREQVVTMLYHFAVAQGYDVSEGGMAAREYPDFDQVSTWAGEAVTWAVNAGILTGTDAGTLNPQGTATRAQLASLLVRFLSAVEA